MACGTLFPHQRANPCPLHWKVGVLTTGPLGRYHKYSLLVYIFLRSLKYCPTIKALNGNNEVDLGPKFSKTHGIWAKCVCPTCFPERLCPFQLPTPLPLLLLFSIMLLEQHYVISTPPSTPIRKMEAGT